jgi:hypothetical protein
MPEPVPYASAIPDTPSRARLRTVIAGAWLVILLYAAYAAFWNLFDDQERIGTLFFTLFDNPNFSQLTYSVRLVVDPVFTAFVIGAASAAVLWHWPIRRATWILLLPAAAAVWGFIGPPHEGLVMAPFLALTVGAVQCACVFAGIRFGRPITALLANWILPPSLNAELTALWTRR